VRYERYFSDPWLETAAPGFVDHLLDVDGRPLAEGNAPEALKAGVAFDYRSCPHGASRDGGLMNTTALKQVVLCWDDLLEDLLTLRTVFLRRYPTDMNALLLTRLASFLTATPGFLVRKGVFRWDAVPRGLSGLFKSAQGLYLTANDMILRGGPDAAFAPVTTDGFLAHTEAHRIFWVGEHVCSSPPALVRQFVDLALTGGSSERGDSWLNAHLGDTDAIDYAELKLKAQMAQRVAEAWIADALDASFGRTGEQRAPALAAIDHLSGLHLGRVAHDFPHPDPAELEKMVMIPASSRRKQALDFCARYLSLQRHHVGHMRSLQVRIDRTLGRASETAFSFERYWEHSDLFRTNTVRREMEEFLDLRAVAAWMVED